LAKSIQIGRISHVEQELIQHSRKRVFRVIELLAEVEPLADGTPEMDRALLVLRDRDRPGVRILVFASKRSESGSLCENHAAARLDVHEEVDLAVEVFCCQD
jgi:hypothetical protein